MITPSDRELIAAMVGQEFFDEPGRMPNGFDDEYNTRLGMLKRAGSPRPGLGHEMLVGLLRDWNVSQEKQEQPVRVGNWRTIKVGTPIVCEGRRGQFVELSSAGMVIIKLDGYNSPHEVHGSQVQLAKPLVKDVADSEFEEHPDDKLTPKQKMLENAKQADTSDNPVEDAEDSWRDDGMKDHKLDEIFAFWGGIEAGTDIKTVKGQFAGKFVDLDDNNKVVLEVKGDFKTYEPDELMKPTLKPAAK